MNRTLTLIAVALATGMGYEQAATLVEEMAPTLPADDIEAGRLVASAANVLAYPA